jgi:hypothetical protein
MAGKKIEVIGRVMAAKNYFQCKGTFAIPMSDQIDRLFTYFFHNL